MRDNDAPRAKGQPVEHLHNEICQMLLCKPLVRKSPSGWRLIASVFHFVVTVQTPSLARRRAMSRLMLKSAKRASLIENLRSLRGLGKMRVR
jgi:hypothetical protein